jgi:hypothetical protein
MMLHKPLGEGNSRSVPERRSRIAGRKDIGMRRDMKAK